MSRESWPEVVTESAQEGYLERQGEVSGQKLPWPTDGNAFTCAKESSVRVPQGSLLQHFYKLSITKNLMKVFFKIESTINLCQAQRTSMPVQDRSIPGRLLVPSTLTCLAYYLLSTLLWSWRGQNPWLESCRKKGWISRWWSSDNVSPNLFPTSGNQSKSDQNCGREEA